MADFLDIKRQEIRARLDELKPSVDEYQRLEAAAAALDSASDTAPTNGSPATPRARKATVKAPASVKEGTRPRGRPKGSGSRGAEAVALVRESPGITIPQIAERMGIKQNYLYRLLPALAEEGLVEKDGKGWKPKATVEASVPA